MTRASGVRCSIPPGTTWPAFLDLAPDEVASFGTGLGRQMVEMNAYCLWLAHWYDGYESDDAAQMQEAVAELEEASSWQTFSDELTTDAGFRQVVQTTIDAAVAGEADQVLEQLELNCTGTWPPLEGRG